MLAYINLFVYNTEIVYKIPFGISYTIAIKYVKDFFNIMDISEKISFIRKHLNLNQKDFAKLLNVTQAAISRYEKGDRKPNFAFLETLIKTLNINPMWLFLDYPDMYTNIELLFISQENLDLLKDINAALTQKELNEKLICF